MRNTDIHFALVGYGAWGPNLARNVECSPHAQLRWICDRDRAKLLRAGASHPSVRKTADINDVLSDSHVDAVLIATPVSTHYRLAMAAIHAGKHVFVEKPLAESSNEARELVQASEQASLTLMTGHTFLYVPGILRIKEMLNSGEIGDVLHISSSRLGLGPFRSDANVVWDLMPHDIAILLYLLDGAEPRQISASGWGHLIPNVEDTVSAFFSYEIGTTAEIQASWIYPHKTREVTVVGSRKMIIFDDTQALHKIRVIDRRFELAQPSSNLGEFHMADRYGDTYIPLLDKTEPLFIELCEFAECIRSGCRPLSDGNLSVKVIEHLEAISSCLADAARLDGNSDSPVALANVADHLPVQDRVSKVGTLATPS